MNTSKQALHKRSPKFFGRSCGSLALSMVFLWLSHPPVHAQPFAFPGAYGAAANTEGSRGGVVLHVSSLEDGSRDDVGTLRWAIQAEEHKALDRTIVFDVSGVIELNDWIRCSNAPGDEGGYTGSLHLAGQSAPEGGITITGERIVLSGLPSVIVRYLKFRNTGGYSGSLHMGRGDSAIIDHCSISHVSNSTAVSMSARQTDDFSVSTFSNNLFGQCSYSLIIGESTPADDRQEDGSFSVIRNAYYNVGWRIPFKGGSAIKVDAVNNLVHNWQNRLIRMDHWNYELNHIENHYQAGGNTSNRLLWCSYNSNPSATPTIYNENNFLQDEERGNYSVPEGFDTDESVAWTEFQDNFQSLPADWFASSRLPILGRPYEIFPNAALKDELLPLVGASQYITNEGTVGFHRDAYDTEFVSGIMTDSDERRNSTLELPVQSLANARPASWYNPSKSDHIPEVWYDARMPDGADHTDIAPSGYTWLEEYLNQVDSEADVPDPVEPMSDAGVGFDAGPGPDASVADGGGGGADGGADGGALDAATSGDVGTMDGDSGGCSVSTSEGSAHWLLIGIAVLWRRRAARHLHA